MGALYRHHHHHHVRIYAAPITNEHR